MSADFGLSEDAHVCARFGEYLVEIAEDDFVSVALNDYGA